MAGPHSSKSSAPSAGGDPSRKSRWESSSAAGRNQTAESKPTAKHNPSPKPGPSASPAQNKQQHGPNHAGPQFPFPDPAAMGPPPPPPAYGFHMLERRSIVLYDGSVRSYFALPPDYQDFPTRPVLRDPRFIGAPEFGASPFGFQENRDYRNHSGLDGPGSMKRKYREEGKDPRVEKEELARQRLGQNSGPNGYPMRPAGGEFSAGPSSNSGARAAKYSRMLGGFENSAATNKHPKIDQSTLKKSFLHFVKLVYENPVLKTDFLENGKQGRLQCLACGRSSKDFPDMHALLMHTYYSDNVDLHVDHLGLHKALCVLMGWDGTKPPDNSMSYQFLPADEAARNQDDLIMWPPTVIIHNTVTGKGKEGRVEGLGNKAMDTVLRDLGFGTGKSKSLYGKDGHMGITLVKFAGDQPGLKDAIRFVQYFEKENRGRRAWSGLQPLSLGKDDEKNPSLVKVDERTGEKKRIFYGYLGTVADLDKVDFDTRKKVLIESRKEYKGSR